MLSLLQSYQKQHLGLSLVPVCVRAHMWVYVCAYVCVCVCVRAAGFRMKDRAIKQRQAPPLCLWPFTLHPNSSIMRLLREQAK